MSTFDEQLWAVSVSAISSSSQCHQKRPEGKATVAGCIGVALDLLDNWLGGRHPDAPAGLTQKTQLPTGHWIGERAATDVLTLAANRRAFPSLHTLNVALRR